jgi:uncharacterized MAPEG superfamily protein
MPFAYWCVLVAGLLPIPLAALARAGAGVDNRDPRAAVARLLPRQRRAHAAHLNAYENFPLFAAAVIIAVTSGVPHATVNLLAVIYLVLRIAHALLYVADLATARSMVFALAWVVNVAIFVLPALH